MDVPDSRGRTGLDRSGVGLDHNPDVGIARAEVTSDGWHVLPRTTFTYRGRDGQQVMEGREVSEELGVTVGDMQHVFDLYMSPGSVTERVHFYAAPYSPNDRTTPGGGLQEEGEDIEVLECRGEGPAQEGDPVESRTCTLCHAVMGVYAKLSAQGSSCGPPHSVVQPLARGP